jgi:hypothetical protein
MAVILSEETQKLIEHYQMELGVQSPDLLIRFAFDALLSNLHDQPPDAETWAAIEEAIAQADRGEGIPWEKFREEFKSRFIAPQTPLD